MKEILLGFNEKEEIKLSTLSIHCVILGLSGRGKTVSF